MAPATASVVAACWLSRRDDQILAVRPRGLSVFFLPGGLPETRETLQQAAAREIREETSMAVDPDALKEVVRVEDDAYGRPGVRVELVCFEGPGTGAAVAQPPEIAEVAWLGPNEWHLFAPAVRTALGRLSACEATAP